MIDYNRAIQLSYQTIYSLNIDRLPIDPLRIARQNGISLVSYSQIAEMTGRLREEVIRQTGTEAGALWKHGDRYVIVYNDNDNYPRIRWTVAHELGHYFMNHDLKHTPDQEAEANTFAKHLLTPFPLLYYVREFHKYAYTVQDVSKMFGLSLEAAHNVIASANKSAVYARAYLNSELVDIFLPAINKEMMSIDKKLFKNNALIFIS